MTVRSQGWKQVNNNFTAKVKVAQRLLPPTGVSCVDPLGPLDFQLLKDSLSSNLWRNECPRIWAPVHTLSLRKHMRWWAERGWMWASKKFNIQPTGGKRVENLGFYMWEISSALTRTYMRDNRNWSRMSKRNVRRVPHALMYSLLLRRMLHLQGKTIQ